MKSILRQINIDIPTDAFPILIIPFFLFLFFLLFPKQIFRESVSILGRLISILIILYYSNIHFLYGLLTCILIILYHQSDFLQQMIYIHGDEGFRPETDNILPIPQIETPIDKTKLENSNAKSETLETIVEVQVKGTTPIQHAYPNKIKEVVPESEMFFKKKHCKNQKLKYRNIEVKHPEMIPFLFPEVSYDSKPCNPCDSTCSFSLSKQITEQELFPKSTQNSMITDVMEWTESLVSLSNKSDPYIGVKTVNASYF
jgi:hypothetical protein